MNGNGDYTFYGSEGGLVLNDAAATDSPDPYSAPPEGDYPDASSYAEDYAVDTPDVDMSGGLVPGANLSAFLPDNLGGQSFAKLANSLSIGGKQGIVYQGNGGSSVSRLGVGMRSQLLSSASSKAGFRMTSKKIVYLMKRFGIGFVAGLTGLDANALLWLFMTRPRRGRRGPFLRTVVKRIRQGDRYRHMAQRYFARAHVGGGHRRHAGGFRRRRRR